MKDDLALLLVVFAVLGGIAWLMVWSTKHDDQIVEKCRAAGGDPVRLDKKPPICLAKGSVIRL